LRRIGSEGIKRKAGLCYDTVRLRFALNLTKGIYRR
jgi:hypothetical protein